MGELDFGEGLVVFDVVFVEVEFVGDFLSGEVCEKMGDYYVCVKGVNVF